MVAVRWTTEASQSYSEIPAPAWAVFVGRPVYTQGPPVAMQSCSTTSRRMRALESAAEGVEEAAQGRVRDQPADEVVGHGGERIVSAEPLGQGVPGLRRGRHRGENESQQDAQGHRSGTNRVNPHRSLLDSARARRCASAGHAPEQTARHQRARRDWSRGPSGPPGQRPGSPPRSASQLPSSSVSSRRSSARRASASACWVRTRGSSSRRRRTCPSSSVMVRWRVMSWCSV
jgi:hypothetical protein